MSYICAYSKKLVQNEPCILIPIELRKVKYNYYLKKDAFSEKEYLFSTEGYEIVKEVKVSKNNYENFIKENKPKYTETKEVNVFLKEYKNKNNNKMNFNINIEDNND